MSFQGMIKVHINTQKHSLLLIISLFLTTAAVLPAQDMTVDFFNQGIQLYSIRDFAGAAEYLDQVVILNPDHDQARYYLIFSLSQTGRSRKALQHAKILAGRFPQRQEYADIVKNLEAQQFRLTTPRRSSSPVEEPAAATKAQPERSATRPTVKKNLSELDRAVALIDEENYDAATDSLQKILKNAPRNAMARHYLGVTAFNRGNFAEAAEHFEQAIAAGSKEFDSSFLAGSSYLNLQLLDKAEIHFKKAIGIKKDIFSQLNLAEIKLKTWRFSEAKEIYNEILKKHPDVTDARSGLAQILFEQGHIEAASAAINEVLSERPENGKARLIKAKILMETKMYAEAAEEARLAFNLHPGNAEYRACLALTLIRNFQIPQGMDEARAALELQPGNIEAMLALAEGLIVSGDVAGAEKQLSLTEKHARHPEVSFLSASLANTKGDIDAARQHYEDYRSRSRGQPRAMLEYARFIETAGSHEEAVAAYNEIISKHKQTTFAAEARTAVERLARAENRPAKPAASRIPIPGLHNP